MAKNRRPAEELSIEELEALLARKKMEASKVRLERFRNSGRALRIESNHEATEAESPVSASDESAEVEASARWKGVLGRVFGRALLLIEIAAVVGLVFVLVNGLGALKELNQQVVEIIAMPTASATPLITAVVLPSGHTSPISPGGARPNEDEIPSNLRPLVQSLAAIPIPTPGPEQAVSLLIPSLWNAPAPIVQGDGWEQLKKGVGQHVGSANPGQNGNLVLSAHNDIFGELFRYLDTLQPGDEIIVSTSRQDRLYRVTGMKIVEPSDVGVLSPTEKPTITLISCYPYLVDNLRIVVFGELDES